VGARVFLVQVHAGAAGLRAAVVGRLRGKAKGEGYGGRLRGKATGEGYGGRLRGNATGEGCGEGYGEGRLRGRRQRTAAPFGHDLCLLAYTAREVMGSNDRTLVGSTE
jgi:hypothetical protein